MIIPSLIRTLLEENSATIAGLGTFFVEKQPAQVKDDVVLPPQNMILFRYSKDDEGFDFVTKLSKWKQIRMDAAQAEISEWINLIENGVEHNKSVFLDDFGTFFKDSSGKIVFQSIIIPELNIENEGFDPVFMIQKGNLINEDYVVKDKRSILINKEKKRDKTLFFGIILVAAILLCVLFIKDRFSYIYQTIFVQKEKLDETLKPEGTAFISSVLNEVLEVDTREEKEANPPVFKTEDQYAKVEKPLSPDSIYLPYQKGKFYVIAGSFLKEADALRHIKEKKLEKYDAKLIIVPENQHLRVCIGSFDNEIDASKFMTLNDKSCWILK